MEYEQMYDAYMREQKKKKVPALILEISINV